MNIQIRCVDIVMFQMHSIQNISIITSSIQVNSNFFSHKIPIITIFYMNEFMRFQNSEDISDWALKQTRLG